MHVQLSRRGSVIAVAALAAVCVPLALAAPADRDTGFGTGGVAKTDIRTTGSGDYVNDLALQPDGKLVAVGRSSNTGATQSCAAGMALTVANCGNANDNWSLARYNADGTLDAGFAVAGKASVTLDAPNLGAGELRAVAVNADGVVVAAGDRTPFAGQPGDFMLGAVAFFQSNGNPISYVTLPNSGIAGGYTTLADVAVQPDGKILVAGTKQSGNTDGSIVVARLNADTSLDTSFGTGGLAIVNASPGLLDEARALAIQPDGKVVVVGYATFNDQAFVVARLTSAGVLDGTFGSGGIVTTAPAAQSQGRALAIQSDGKMVVGGASNGGFAVLRYLSDGSLDASFDGDGVVFTAVGVPNAGVNDLVLQTNGRIAAVGNALGGFGFDSGEIEVVRYNADGSLDSGFGTGGIAREFTGMRSFGTSILVQPDGKLVFGGLILKTAGSADSSDYVVVRYVGDSVAPPAAPEVALDISDSVDPVATRGALTYTLHIVNQGDAAAPDVTLSAVLPKVSMGSITTTAGLCRQRGIRLNCSFGSIAPSASVTVTISGTAPRRPDTLVLSGSASTVGDSNLTNNDDTEQTSVQ